MFLLSARTSDCVTSACEVAQVVQMERSNKIESGGWPGHRSERRAVTVAFRASPFAASANRSTAQSPGRLPVLDEQISSEGISAKSKLCHGCKTFLSSQLERA